MKKSTQTVYRCDHCNKPYFRRSAAEVHEMMCTKNPANHRPCFDCMHLCKKKTILYEDEGWGESERELQLLFCNAKQTHLYTPQNEMKRNWFDLGDEANDPMPKQCSQFESSFLEILNNQQI